MKGPLRVAVVGCGGIAQMMHLPTLAERPDLFRIAGLSDVNPATLQAVGGRYGVSVLGADHRELLSRDDVDAVLIASSGSHRQAVLDALAAGKHVFVEKPLGFSVEETEQIAAMARRAPGLLMVGYHKRYDPGYLRARDEVRGLRDLRFVEVTVLHPDDGAYRAHHALLPPADAPRGEPTEEASNRGALEEATRGAVADEIGLTVRAGAPPHHRVATLLLFQSLIHDVDAVRGMLGEPEEVESARTWRGGFAQTSLTRFARDVRVSMSWVSLPGVRHYEERLRFVSPEKRVTLVFPSPYLRHAPTPVLVERMDGAELVSEARTVSYEEAFRAELHHFRDCVAAGRRPETSVDDALGDAQWIRAIARAYA